MNITAILLCLVIILIGVGVFFLALYFKAIKKTDSSTPSTGSVGKSHKGWQIWILFFGIALILTIWTVWGALFFLAVVWILRMDPSADTSFTLSKNEKNTARRVYTWLFLSPIITVPIFIGMAFNLYNSSTNEHVLAALIPLIVHTPLLLGLTSKNRFVYRHTQQGILFIALRAAMASLAMIYLDYDEFSSLAIFLLGNGFLWLTGSIVGWHQISNGKCWFMQRKGETIILPASTQPEKSKTPAMDMELDNILKHLDAKGKLSAKQKALHTFQTGTPISKKRAVEILSKLGEVETF